MKKQTVLGLIFALGGAIIIYTFLPIHDAVIPNSFLYMILGWFIFLIGVVILASRFKKWIEK